jgi:hypothetical protein
MNKREATVIYHVDRGSLVITSSLSRVMDQIFLCNFKKKKCACIASACCNIKRNWDCVTKNKCMQLQKKTRETCVKKYCFAKQCFLYVQD